MNKITKPIQSSNNKNTKKKKNNNKVKLRNVNVNANAVRRMFNLTNNILRTLNKSAVSARLNMLPNTQNYVADTPAFRQAYKVYNDDKLQVLQYIYALLHTDEVYHKGWAIKIPSRIPQPTTTFCFKDVEVLQPNTNGNLGIVWSPNYLATASKMRLIFNADYNTGFANLYVNNDSTLTGTSDNNNYKPHLFRPVNQSFSKYRLTSAMIKIKYIGNVLNQAGTISGCVSYGDFNRYVYGSLVKMTNEVASIYDHAGYSKFGNFDIIKGGLWSRTINLTAQPEGMTAIYIPVDDLNEVFVDDAQMIAGHVVEVQSSAGLGVAEIDPANTNTTYVFAIQGCPNTSSIQVEMYYNFEIVIEDEQVPYFRTGFNALINAQTNTAVRDAMSQSLSQHGVIHPTNSFTDSFASYTKRAFNILKRAKGIYDVLQPVIEAAFTLA